MRDRRWKGRWGTPPRTLGAPKAATLPVFVLGASFALAASAAIASAVRPLPGSGPVRATALAHLAAAPAPPPVSPARLAHVPAAPPPPGFGTGPGYCTEYGVPGTAAPYSFDDVFACSPVDTSGPTPFDSDGTVSFQCVDLSLRFLWAIYGIWAQNVTDGADLVSVVHKSHPWIRVATPSPRSVPVPGDVISLGPGGGSDPSFGHTAVVIASQPSTGLFEIMSQNVPAGYAGEQTLEVDLGGAHDGQVLFLGSWTTASWLETGPRAPQAPGSLTTAGDDANDVQLAWRPPAAGPPVTGYDVYRDGNLVGSTAAGDPGFVDANLPSPGTTVTYSVAAIGVGGAEGPVSGSVAVLVSSPGQLGRAWLDATLGPAYCRRTGLASADYAHQKLSCTTDAGGHWTTSSTAGVDWGYESGRAWLAVDGRPTYCRLTGVRSARFTNQKLSCTTDAGGHWTTSSTAGVDWGYESGRAWLAVDGRPTYCRLTGVRSARFTSQKLSCTTDAGGRWTTSSTAGVDWGQDDNGRAWLAVNSQPTYCRLTGVRSARFTSQKLSCTTDAAGRWTTSSTAGGVDWGYESGRDWLAVDGRPTYCRLTGVRSARFTSQKLSCTTDAGGHWTTSSTAGGVDWGYDSGRAWLAVNSQPTYCRLTGVRSARFTSQKLSCTTDAGGHWTTSSTAGVDWGQDDNGRAWLAVGSQPTYCRLTGVRSARFTSQKLSCTTDAGGHWTTSSTAGVDWGYPD